MGELKIAGSEVKYGTPLVTKLGGLLFTATQIEFPASAETVTGGVELNLAKLGLADEGVVGLGELTTRPNTLGETATGTALPVFAWSTPCITQKAAAEEGVEIAKAQMTAVTVVGGKLFLRFFVQKVIKKNMQECITAEKTETGLVGLGGCQIFVLGK